MFCTTALFISCSDDDNNDPPIGIDETALPGTWKLIAFRVNNGQTFIETDEERTLYSTFFSVGKDFETSLTFNQNPETFESDGGYTTVLTNTIVNQQPTTQEIPTPGFAASGNWQIKDGDLVLEVEGTEESFKITGLNSELLFLEKELNQTFPLPGGTQVSTGMTFFAFGKQ